MAYNNKHCKPCRPIINEVCIDKPENCPEDVCAEIYNAECVILPDNIPENCLGITGGMNIVDAIQIVISAICYDNPGEADKEIPEIEFGHCYHPYDYFFRYFSRLWAIYKNDRNYSIERLLDDLLKSKIYITTCNTCYDVGDIHIFGGSGVVNSEYYPGYYFNDNINGYSDCISSLESRLGGFVEISDAYIEILSNANENNEIHSILCSIGSHIDMNIFSADDLEKVFEYFIEQPIKLEIFENYIVFSQIH